METITGLRMLLVKRKQEIVSLNAKLCWTISFVQWICSLTCFSIGALWGKFAYSIYNALIFFSTTDNPMIMNELWILYISTFVVLLLIKEGKIMLIFILKCTMCCVVRNNNSVEIAPLPLILNRELLLCMTGYEILS